MKCKAKVDLHILGDTLLDLKSTSAKSASSFRASSESFGYYRQMAFYNLPIRAKRIILFASSKHEGKGNFSIELKNTSTEILKGYSEAVYLLKIAEEWRWINHKQYLTQYDTPN